jgi:lipopolysaccharide transport system ATP-binding protein
MKDIVIGFKGVTKNYKLYSSAVDRVKEALSLTRKKRHKIHSALKDINLEIKKGEILGVVGRNGCGKSTLLKLIAGVLQPTQGNIQVNGHVTALLELGAGFNPEFTGMENIYFYATILGLSEEGIEAKMDDIIAFAEIGEYIDQPIKTYSSGMRSRLSFAVAIHIDPEILILDEVLSVGDVLFRRKCYAKMEEHFASGKTIIYVSHDANSVRKLCTRAILLHESHIVMDGDPSEVTKYYEKLLFSDVSRHKEIINEISNLDAQASELKTIEVQHDSHVGDIFPSSSVTYGTGGVEIEEQYIENELGERVNVLGQSKRYSYTYQLKFVVDCEDVSFNMLIKSIDGVVISGAALHRIQDKIDYVKAGTKLLVSWSFDCMLTTGDYFTNIGVVSTSNSERDFLLRIVDADMFKVKVSKEKSFISGIVSLNQSCEVEVLT